MRLAHAAHPCLVLALRQYEDLRSSSVARSLEGALIGVQIKSSEALVTHLIWLN